MNELNSIIKHKFTLIVGEIASGKSTLASKLYNTIIEMEASTRNKGLLLVKDFCQKENFYKSLKKYKFNKNLILTYNEFIEIYFYKFIEYIGDKKIKIVNEEIKLYLIKKLIENSKVNRGRFSNLIISSKELAYKVYKIYKVSEDNLYSYKGDKNNLYRKMINNLSQENIEDIRSILEMYKDILIKNDLADNQIIYEYYIEKIMTNHKFIESINKFKYIICDDFSISNECINKFIALFYRKGTKLVAFSNNDISSNLDRIERYINEIFIQHINEFKLLKLKNCKVLLENDRQNLQKIREAFIGDMNALVNYSKVKFIEDATSSDQYSKGIMDSIEEILHNDEQCREIIIITSSKTIKYNINKYISESKIENSSIDKINQSIVYNLNNTIKIIKENKEIGIDNSQIKFLYEDRIPVLNNRYFKNIITYCKMSNKIKYISIELKDIAGILSDVLRIKYSEATLLAKNYNNSDKYNMRFLERYLSREIIDSYIEFINKIEKNKSLNIEIDKFIYKILDEIIGLPDNKKDTEIISKILSVCYDFIKINSNEDNKDINDDLIDFIVDNIFYQEEYTLNNSSTNTTIRLMSFTEYQKRLYIADYFIVNDIRLYDNLEYLRGKYMDDNFESNEYDINLLMNLFMRCRKDILINSNDNEIFKNLKNLLNKYDLSV